MNLAQLNTRDGYALMLAAGIKIGGGSWSQALLWGMGSRLLMKYLGFPDAMPLAQPAQSLFADAGAFFQRVFGRPPDMTQQSAPMSGADDSQTIDAEYTEYGTQTQGS